MFRRLDSNHAAMSACVFHNLTGSSWPRMSESSRSLCRDSDSWATAGILRPRIAGRRFTYPNIADNAPFTVYEIAQIVGAIYESSAHPLTNPWMGHVDVTLARSLGFQPKILTVYQASREGRL
jgi:hypothetical protein